MTPTDVHDDGELIEAGLIRRRSQFLADFDESDWLQVIIRPKLEDLVV